MVRTTLLLPAELKRAAEACARAKGLSLGALIRRDLEGTIRKTARGHRPHGDPIFDGFEPWMGDGPADLAAEHDVYLYGR